MLKIELPLVVFQMVNFLLFLGVLWIFLFKPLKGFLKAREEKIRTDLASAKTGKEEQGRVLEEHKARLKELEDRTNGIIQEAVSKGDIERVRILEAAQASADRILKKAEEEIKREKDRAVSELKGEVAHLSILAATRILERSIDEATAHSLVDGFIDSIEKDVIAQEKS